MLDVMLVDDDDLVRKGLSKIIKWDELGARVVFSARDGSEAAAFLKDNHIDLVISDIKMPVMDGIALSEYIRRNYGSTEIILLSAYGEFEYAKSAVRLNVKEYLLKPIDRGKIEELSEIIRKAAVEKERFHSIKKLIHTNQFKEQVKRAVVESDIVSLNHIIDIDEKYRTNDIDAIKEYYSTIIDILFKCINNTDTEGIDKGEIIDEMLRIGNLNRLKEFVLQRVQRTMHLVNINKKNHTDMLVEYIKDYILQNYRSSDINAGSIADEFKITTSYLGYLFKKKVDVPVSQYIIQLKMSEAARLLRETNLMVSEIAGVVGYNDINFFSRRFKKEYGYSPGEYRVIKKEKEME